MARRPAEGARSVEAGGEGLPAPSVTVLIAAYNAADFIDRAIASALDQAPVEVEVLVVDDCSTDATVARVRAISSLEPRVRLVELPVNGGPSVARNEGLACARGEWVAVLDADDAYLPGRLAALLDVAQASGADLVADNFHFYHALEGRIGDVGLVPGGEPELVGAAELIDRSHAYGAEADWGLLKPMLNRAFLDRHGLRYPTHTRHGEDFLFVVNILLAGGVFAVTREPFYLYTTRDSGMSRTVIDYDSMWRQSMTLLNDTRFASDRNLLRAVKRRVRRVRWYAAERSVVSLIMAKEYGRLGLLAVKNPWAAAVLAKRVLRRGTSRLVPGSVRA